MFSAHRLELAAIDAAVEQVGAALRDRDAEHAILDATDVTNTLQILTLRAASQRDRKHLAALTAERDAVNARFAERLAGLAGH
jgi:hypothetical protein